MLEDFSAFQLLALGAFVFFAGIVDALAGGGGLITLPAYLSFGLKPALVLGTNKLASSIGTIVASAHYLRKLRISPKSLARVCMAALLGAILGARLAVYLGPRLLQYLLLLAIPSLAYTLYFHRHFGALDRSHHLAPKTLRFRSLALALGVGAYDGFFGPGAGTFFALGLTRLCHYDLLRATAMAKLLNLSSNLAALFIFLILGKVHVGLGLSLSLASMAGNYLGSSLGMRRVHIIRPVVICVLAGLFVKLLFL